MANTLPSGSKLSPHASPGPENFKRKAKSFSETMQKASYSGRVWRKNTVRVSIGSVLTLTANMSWQKLQMALTDDGQLLLYKNETSHNPLKILHLSNFASVQPSGERVNSKVETMSFRLEARPSPSTSGSTKDELFCVSPETHSQWFTRLEDAIKKHQQGSSLDKRSFPRPPSPISTIPCQDETEPGATEPTVGPDSTIPCQDETEPDVDYTEPTVGPDSPEDENDEDYTEPTDNENDDDYTEPTDVSCTDENDEDYLKPTDEIPAQPAPPKPTPRPRLPPRTGKSTAEINNNNNTNNVTDKGFYVNMKGNRRHVTDDKTTLIHSARWHGDALSAMTFMKSKNPGDGTFLVRRSHKTPGNKTLLVVCNGAPCKFEIEEDPISHSVTMLNVPFQNLESLLQHYTTTNLPNKTTPLTTPYKQL